MDRSGVTTKKNTPKSWTTKNTVTVNKTEAALEMLVVCEKTKSNFLIKHEYRMKHPHACVRTSGHGATHAESQRVNNKLWAQSKQVISPLKIHTCRRVNVTKPGSEVHTQIGVWSHLRWSRMAWAQMKPLHLYGRPLNTGVMKKYTHTLSFDTWVSLGSVNSFTQHETNPEVWLDQVWGDILKK